MHRKRRSATTRQAPPQQEAKAPQPPRRKRTPKHDLSTWTVTDDWPEKVPVTEEEVRIFESWFGDLFDELFGPEYPTDARQR